MTSPSSQTPTPLSEVQPAVRSTEINQALSNHINNNAYTNTDTAPLFSSSSLAATNSMNYEQTRMQSMVESLANMVVGYIVALISQLILFPLFGIHIPFSSNLAIGAWFTVISLIRSYVLRRYFNGLKFRSAAGQTRAQSMIESVANIVVGYAVSLLSQLLVFPFFGIDIPMSTNLAIGAWFTVISLIRSYVLRRYFNGLKFKSNHSKIVEQLLRIKKLLGRLPLFAQR